MKKKKASKKSQQRYALHFTFEQLVHLRDVFSVMIDQENDVSMSSYLASIKACDSNVELDVWNEIVNACIRADISLGEDAPNYEIFVTCPEIKIASESPTKKFL